MRNCFLFALMIKGKKGGAVGVRDASSGQTPRKKRKVEDLDNDLATMTHEKSNDNCNAHAHERGCGG